MYDRLGDLLSETLESGKVQFIRVEQESPGSTQPQEDKDGREQRTAGVQDKEHNTSSYAKPTHRRVLYRKLTPELERCYRLLDITVSATLEEVKKAYKEKLKYYHPDRHADNAVLQKIATDKTRQVVEAYKLIVSFLSK